MLEYILIAVILCVILNAGYAYFISRFFPNVYYYTQEEYDKLKASRTTAYNMAYPISWKPGDVKSIEDWGMPHVGITVGSVFWIITLPLLGIMAAAFGFIAAIYFLVKIAAKAGRKHVDKSN